MTMLVVLSAPPKMNRMSQACFFSLLGLNIFGSLLKSNRNGLFLWQSLSNQHQKNKQAKFIWQHCLFF